MISLGVIWGATAINLRGAVPVGKISIVAGLFIIVGFLVAAVGALPHVHHSPLTPFASESGKGMNGLAVGLSIALWNYIGWDNASTVEGEVKDAGKTYPKALAITLPLVAVGYFIPLLATLGATDWTTWRDGGWPSIVRDAVGGGSFGGFIASWVAVGGMVSALGTVQRAAAVVLTHSVCDGGGRSAAEGDQEDGPEWDAVRRRARLGGRVLGVRAGAAGEAGRCRRRALCAGVGPGVRGLDCLTEEGT